VREWFERYPDAIIGLLLEPSNVVVLTVEGPEKFAKILSELPDGPRFLYLRPGQTVVHVIHCVFAKPSGVRVSGTKALEDGLSLSGSGFIPVSGKVCSDVVLGEIGQTALPPPRLPERFLELAKAAPSIQKAIEVEVLDEAPDTMSRPLSLVHGHPYAATWVWIERYIHEGENLKGEKIEFVPPRVERDQVLWIIREDGACFGEGAEHPLLELDMDIHLPEKPSQSSVWSRAGYTRFSSGEKPCPSEVFGRVTATVDRFIDFTGSLADQKTMCECIACFVISTYMLDAMTVAGYLWINGDRGSGKSHLLSVIGEMAYLGQVVLAGGSFATLRDLADYGGFLGFDDAEEILDRKKGDPDKRNLLYAGNRKGAVVTVKEPIGNRGWRTRTVSTFCPRAFSAIDLPPNVLARRAIVIPLLRSTDPKRVSLDPADHGRWPVDRQQLVDDLWALGLANLKYMRDYDARAVERARLKGMSVDPWRGVLAIALWLDEQGVPDLFSRMEALSFDYDKRRSRWEPDDVAKLIVQALCQCAGNAGCATTPDTVTVTVTQVRSGCLELATDSDVNVGLLTPQKVGRVLSQLGSADVPRPGGKGSRKHNFDLAQLELLKKNYEVEDI
jgi:hypothetical protein